MSSHEDRTRIRRGAKPRKRVAKGRPAARRRGASSSLDRALKTIPPRYVAAARKTVTYGLAAGVVVVVAAGLVAMRLPQMIGIELGEMVGRAGFAVKRVEIRGIDHMDRTPVENAALDEKERAMPLVDLSAIRERLLAQGWVADARVSRRLPDTLVIDIVERQPAALWQYQRRLMLVDKDGRPIERVRLTGSPLPDLPIVIGPGANRQLGALEKLLAAAPALKPVLDGATWIGNRRWDIRFRSGETLSLPEGAQEARKALVYFAQQDEVARLLGQGITRFDMRVPGKLVLTMPKRDEHGRGGAMLPASAPAQRPTQAEMAKDI
ncbi:MAG TPA: cell division protein FtsQ/DivIB [Sphingomonadaceae bacterium]|nr:cell division protein FtsQ/DivIB [Sphingomonadaceae bacterium]